MNWESTKKLTPVKVSESHTGAEFIFNSSAIAVVFSVLLLMLSVFAQPATAQDVRPSPVTGNSQLLAAGEDSKRPVLPQYRPPVEQEMPVFQELRDKFDRGLLFHATYSYLHRDSFTGEETSLEGVIWVGHEEYRVEGGEQVMVTDGEISHVYDAVENRVIINTYDEETDDFAPSRMLRGVDESYEITEQTGSDETVVTLVNEDPFALYSHVEIRIDKNGIPFEIEASDQFENTSITTFSGGRFIPYDETLFQVDVPDSAERVDMRY